MIFKMIKLDGWFYDLVRLVSKFGYKEKSFRDLRERKSLTIIEKWIINHKILLMLNDTMLNDDR